MSTCCKFICHWRIYQPCFPYVNNVMVKACRKIAWCSYLAFE